MDGLFSGEKFELTAPVQEKKIKHKANGYAAIPGTGPKGTHCKTCEHIVRSHHGNKHYLKCELMRSKWTSSYGTDIRASSPSCRHWEGK